MVTLHAGTFSGLMQTAITTPTELLKIRLQLQTQLPGSPGYVGPIRLLKQVTMREGISGGSLCQATCDRGDLYWEMVYLGGAGRSTRGVHQGVLHWGKGGGGGFGGRGTGLLCCWEE